MHPSLPHIHTTKKRRQRKKKKVRTVKNHKCDYSFAPSYVNLLLLRRNRKIESGYIGLHICEQTLLWQTQKSSFLNSPLPPVHFLHAAFSYLFEVALVLKTCDRRKNISSEDEMRREEIINRSCASKSTFICENTVHARK